MTRLRSIEARLRGRLRQALAEQAAKFHRRPYAPLFGAIFRDGAGASRLLGIAEHHGSYRQRRVRDGNELRFEFLCPFEGLCGFGLALGEPSGSVAVRLSLEIAGRPGRGEGIEWTIDPATLGLTDWPWLEFEPRPDSRGQRVRIRVRAQGGAISIREIRVPRRRLRARDGCWLPSDTGARYVPQLWQATPAAPAVRPAVERPLRILTYRWHVAHQYEIYKLPHRFVLAYGLPGRESRFCSRWAYDERPKPPNATFLPWDEVRLDEIDVVLLHFDENVIDWQNAAPLLPADWGATFQFFERIAGKPRVAVCHGTPQFRGMCDATYDGPLFEELPEPKRRLLDLLGDTPVVCNSHQAQEQWGFPRSRVIWHGFDPDEFPLGARRKGILGQGRALDSRPHYRGKRIHDELSRRLPEAARPAVLEAPAPADLPWAHGNAYGVGKFRAYVRALGEYSVYLNSTLNSPMPRSRGEAMMCGLATVSVRNHDVDRFVDNEHNGFFSPDVDQLADYLTYLHRHPERAREIGQRGRERATERFHISRFLDDWDRVLRELTG